MSDFFPDQFPNKEDETQKIEPDKTRRLKGKVRRPKPELSEEDTNEGIFGKFATLISVVLVSGLLIIFVAVVFRVVLWILGIDL